MNILQLPKPVETTESAQSVEASETSYRPMTDKQRIAIQRAVDKQTRLRSVQPKPKARLFTKRRIGAGALVILIGGAGIVGIAVKRNSNKSDAQAIESEFDVSASSAAALEISAAKKDGFVGGGDDKASGGISDQPTTAVVGTPTDPLPTATNRGQLIKIGTIDISVPTDKYQSSTAQLSTMPGRFGGFIESSQQSADPGTETQRTPRTNTVVMRVPNTRFDDARSAIGGLGKLISEQISGQEVSAQLVDIEARLTSLRLQEDAYRKLFEQAKAIQDIITVQERLTEVRTQIEQITAQKSSLQDQVAYSTLTITVRENLGKGATSTNAATPTFGKQTSSAWKNATKALSAVLTGLAVILVWSVPFLPLIAIAGFGLLIALRIARRRRLAHAVAMQHLAAQMQVPTTPTTNSSATGTTSVATTADESLEKVEAS